MPIDATAYFLDAAATPLVRRSLILADPLPSEVIIEVEACGVCHTDLGYANGSVAPKHALPLVLGHEIVGRVVAAGEQATSLMGRRVVVPAVLPCGECAFCRAGRSNACQGQKMPGNDINGGFASHVLLPSSSLVAVDSIPASVDARTLSVVADAVSTAYQATRRAGLQKGDLAIVIGAGGVGGFLAQIASALGAHVIVADVDPRRLETASSLGANTTIDVRNRESRDVRKSVQAIARERGISSLGFRIFECSGTPAGQQLAFGLLATAATLVVVGYTPKTVELRLSNVMAFDASIHGTWGCPPSLYPEVLAMVFDGRLKLDPSVDYAPMSTINDILSRMAKHELGRRMILDPKM